MLRIAHVLALLVLLAFPATSSAITFHVVNDQGVPQVSYLTYEGAPGWSFTDGFGTASGPAEAGQVFRFTRNFSTAAYPPPEGVNGQSYTVTDPNAEVTITLPSTGPGYQPALSDAERWVIGKANQRRAEEGVAPLKVSTVLTAAADSMARRSVVENRWPSSFLTVLHIDFGWPHPSFAALDAPGTSPTAAIGHWTDGSVREDQLVNAAFDAIGVASGDGWWIAELGDCPADGRAVRCGMTNDTGDPTIVLPSEGGGGGDDGGGGGDGGGDDGGGDGTPFTIRNVLPGNGGTGGGAGTVIVGAKGAFSTARLIKCPAGPACAAQTKVTTQLAVPSATLTPTKIGGLLYSVAGGTEAKVKSKLNKKGRKKLKRKGSMNVKVTVKVTRGTAVLEKTIKVVLQRPPD